MELSFMVLAFAGIPAAGAAALIRWRQRRCPPVFLEQADTGGYRRWLIALFFAGVVIPVIAPMTVPLVMDSHLTPAKYMIELRGSLGLVFVFCNALPFIFLWVVVQPYHIGALRHDLLMFRKKCGALSAYVVLLVFSAFIQFSVWASPYGSGGGKSTAVVALALFPFWAFLFMPFAFLAGWLLGHLFGGGPAEPVPGGRGAHPPRRSV